MIPTKSWKEQFPSMQWPEYLHRKLKTDWVLSPACRDNCECYFLRHWETKYFLDFTNNIDYLKSGIIRYEGQEYRCCFNGIDKLADCKQVALSFRKPKPELNLPAYVLVKGIPNA